MEYSYFYSTPYLNKLAQFAKLRDTFQGNERIKEAATAYLPKPAGMPDESYAAYKARTLFYPVIERTVRGLLGIVFRVPPTFKLPGKLRDWEESMTAEGDSIMEAFRIAVREAIHMGRHGIMLDLPETADVNAVPYISQFTAESITAWQRRYVRGMRRLTRVMLAEQPDTDGDDVGRFLELVLDTDGPTPVYRIKKWEVKFGNPGKDNRPVILAQTHTVHTPTINGRELDYIPFYFVGPYSNKPDLEKSPLLDLADANLHHYTLQADYRQCLYMLAQPTPYIVGDIPDDKVPKKIGASAFWVLPSEVQDIGMLEYSGSGVASLLDALTRNEEYMAALGAKLVHRQRQPETAEAVKTQSRDELSVLEAVVQSCTDAFKAAIRDAGKWTGTTGGDVETVTDFAEGRMDSAMLTALFQTMQAGGISRAEYHRNLQRGDIIAPTRTLEEEMAAVEAEAAERQRKAAEAMAQQQQAAGGGEEDDADEGADEEDDNGPATGAKGAPVPPGKGKKTKQL